MCVAPVGSQILGWIHPYSWVRSGLYCYFYKLQFSVWLLLFAVQQKIVMCTGEVLAASIWVLWRCLTFTVVLSTDMLLYPWGSSRIGEWVWCKFIGWWEDWTQALSRAAAGQPILLPQQLQTALKIPHFNPSKVLLPWIENCLVLCLFSCCLQQYSRWLILLPTALFYTLQKLAVQQIGCPPSHGTQAELFLPAIHVFGPTKPKEARSVAFAKLA